jgi:hypothetical protein
MSVNDDSLIQRHERREREQFETAPTKRKVKISEELPLVTEIERRDNELPPFLSEGALAFVTPKDEFGMENVCLQNLCESGAGERDLGRACAGASVSPSTILSRRL